MTYSCAEEGVRIFITRNGDVIEHKNPLTDTGVYLLSAQDQAGNVSTYDFVIVSYMNTNSWVFIVALVILVLSIVGYLIYSRKAMKVR